MTQIQDPIKRPVETARLDAFVDASFAFAVTLLIIAGAEPLTGLDSLMRALARIPAFAAGFMMVVLFWIGHREFGRHAPRRDGWSTVLSLAIVFTMLIYVFPLRLLMDSMMGFFSGGRLPGAELFRTPGDLMQAYVVYGLGGALLGGLYVLLNGHGRRQALAAGDAAGAEALAEWRDCWAVTSLAGVGSALLALGVPHGLWPGVPGFFYWLIPIGIFVAMRRRARTAPAASN